MYTDANVEIETPFLLNKYKAEPFKVLHIEKSYTWQLLLMSYNISMTFEDSSMTLSYS